MSDLAFRLADAGVVVAAVTSRQLYEDPNADLPHQEVVNGVSIHRVSTARRGRAQLGGRAIDYASFHAAAGLKLLRVLRAGDVAVAKTDPPLISVVASHVAAFRGAVLINWLQDVFPEVALAIAPDMMPPWAARLLTSSRDRSLRRASANVVLSERMREHVAARGINRKHISIVPNWTDADQLTPRVTCESATRARHGLDGKFVVGYSGNLGRAHEFETLVGAARLLRSDARIAFLITGSGAKAESLRRSVEAEGLSSFRFQPLQPSELLADSLAAADVHLVSLLPALEGLIVPSKIYGILAAGRPAVFVGDPRGDVARMIADHDCGISVPNGDSAALAAQLRWLLDTPDRLASMGRNARELAVSRHTSRHALADWLAILERVAPLSIPKYA